MAMMAVTSTGGAAASCDGGGGVWWSWPEMNGFMTLLPPLFFLINLLLRLVEKAFVYDYTPLRFFFF